jgi:hypothetical protein
MMHPDNDFESCINNFHLLCLECLSTSSIVEFNFAKRLPHQAKDDLVAVGFETRRIQRGVRSTRMSDVTFALLRPYKEFQTMGGGNGASPTICCVLHRGVRLLNWETRCQTTW